MRKGEIKRIRDIVISIDAPLDHNVGWVDASDIRYPKLKWYVNGEWDTIQPIDIQQELFEYLPKFNIQNQEETKDTCELLGDKSLPIIGYEDNDDSLYFGVLKSYDSQDAIFNYIRLYSNNPNTSKRDTLGAIRIDKSNGVITQVKNLSILTSDLLGVQNGVASLDGSGKVPSTQLPSYVDDVIEVVNYSDLPQPGESGKIYVVTSTNTTYRWSGSTYITTSEYIPVERGNGTNSVQQKGTGSTAKGINSFAEGSGTITANLGEHAEGTFNKSNVGTRHSVGIGTSDTTRKNAFEIMENGDAYIYGIGGYNGENAGTAGVKTIRQLLTDTIILEGNTTLTIDDFSKEYRIISYDCAAGNNINLNFQNADDIPNGYKFEIICDDDASVSVQCPVSGSESVFVPRGDPSRSIDIYGCAVSKITTFVYIKDSSTTYGFYWLVFD